MFTYLAVSSPNTLAKEIRLLKDYFKKCNTKLEDVDVSQLYDPYPNDTFLKDLICSFAPLIENITNITTLTPLTYNFFEEDGKINDRIFTVRTKNVKFLMKQEDYSHLTDRLLHEFFVGINILNILPTFASVITCYSCTPYLPDVASPCMYAGSEDENANFILYQYIDGPTLYTALENGIVTLTEAWHIIRIVFESINYAYRERGFIHQDLHFGNIVLYDLGENHNITIGKKQFTSKFLPKIIDYGRSQVRVDTNIYSPQDSTFRLPAKTPVHDLRYLLWAFCEHNSTFLGDFVPVEYLEFKREWILIELLNKSDSEVLKIYNRYDKLYPVRFNKTAPPLVMSEYNSQGVNANILSPKPIVPDNLKQTFKEIHAKNLIKRSISKLMYKMSISGRVFGSVTVENFEMLLDLINDNNITLENGMDITVGGYYKTLKELRVINQELENKMQIFYQKHGSEERSRLIGEES